MVYRLTVFLGVRLSLIGLHWWREELSFLGRSVANSWSLRLFATETDFDL